MEWELIDDNEPAAGIELYYFDGEQCSNGLARDFRIQVRCGAVRCGAVRPCRRPCTFTTD